jgi:hypothetical protein
MPRIATCLLPRSLGPKDETPSSQIAKKPNGKYKKISATDETDEHR